MVCAVFGCLYDSKRVIKYTDTKPRICKKSFLSKLYEVLVLAIIENKNKAF